MSFKSVRRNSRDMVNKGTSRLIPNELLQADRELWYSRLRDKDSPLGPQNRMLAAFFLRKTTESVEFGAELSIVKMLGAATRFPEWNSALRHISAAYALSRLVGAIITEDIEYMDEETPYDGTTDNKFLVDYDETVHDDAYGVVVARGRLNEDPFPEGSAEFRGSEAWFFDKEIGLYAHVKTPATTTASMALRLAIATGSEERAAAVLDRQNSITIAPYVSSAYLDARIA